MKEAKYMVEMATRVACFLEYAVTKCKTMWTHDMMFGTQGIEPVTHQALLGLKE